MVPGGIGPLVSLLSSRSEGVQKNAKGTLEKLAKNRKLKTAIAKAGGPRFGGWFG